MQNIAGVIRDTISISLLNRGFAGRIFEEVKQSGAKVVMKNNAVECVLLSPDEYIKLIYEVSDARLPVCDCAEGSCGKAVRGICNLRVRCGREKDILGLWLNETEGKHHWMQIFGELKKRGVEDVLYLGMDGVSGLEEGAFPDENALLKVLCNPQRPIRPWKEPSIDKTGTVEKQGDFQTAHFLWSTPSVS